MSVVTVCRAVSWTALLCLAACAAPSETTVHVCRNIATGQYCVQSGDSLSRIAQRFQTDVPRLKALNGLKSDVIRPGQVLTVSRPQPQSAGKAGKTAVSAAPRSGAPSAPAAVGGTVLQWPLRGTVVVPYGSHNKGIDIAAPRGTLVHAAADGTVMYSGSSVAGYGKLLLVRHSDSMVTAYANNDNLLVPEGAKVKAGQIVASVGDSDRNDGRTALHFEVRVNGKHVNPNLYLPALRHSTDANAQGRGRDWHSR